MRRLQPASAAVLTARPALLQGAIEGKEKVGLKMNLPRERLAEVSPVCPRHRAAAVGCRTSDAIPAACGYVVALVAGASSAAMHA